jgi:hypothetical protein
MTSTSDIACHGWMHVEIEKTISHVCWMYVHKRRQIQLTTADAKKWEMDKRQRVERKLALVDPGDAKSATSTPIPTAHARMVLKETAKKAGETSLVVFRLLDSLPAANLASILGFTDWRTHLAVKQTSRMLRTSDITIQTCLLDHEMRSATDWKLFTAPYTKTTERLVLRDVMDVVPDGLVAWFPKLHTIQIEMELTRLTSSAFPELSNHQTEPLDLTRWLPPKLQAFAFRALSDGRDVVTLGTFTEWMKATHFRGPLHALAIAPCHGVDESELRECAEYMATWEDDHRPMELELRLYSAVPWASLTPWLVGLQHLRLCGFFASALVDLLALLKTTTLIELQLGELDADAKLVSPDWSALSTLTQLQILSLEFLGNELPTFADAQSKQWLEPLTELRSVRIPVALLPAAAHHWPKLETLCICDERVRGKDVERLLHFAHESKGLQSIDASLHFGKRDRWGSWANKVKWTFDDLTLPWRKLAFEVDAQVASSKSFSAWTKACGKGIETLSLGDGYLFTDYDTFAPCVMAMLLHCPRLRHLKLVGPNPILYEDDVKQLTAHCPLLETIEVRSTGSGPAGFSEDSIRMLFRQLPRLRKLHVRGMESLDEDDWNSLRHELEQMAKTQHRLMDIQLHEETEPENDEIGEEGADTNYLMVFMDWRDWLDYDQPQYERQEWQWLPSAGAFLHV